MTTPRLPHRAATAAAALRRLPRPRWPGRLRRNLASRPEGDYALILGLLAALLFASPLLNWWVTLAEVWYAAFVPWAALIALALVVQVLTRP